MKPKNLFLFLLALVFAANLNAGRRERHHSPAPGPREKTTAVKIEKLDVRARIEKENIFFSIGMDVNIRDDAEIPVVTGDVVLIRSKCPEKSRITRKGKTYRIHLHKRGRQHIFFELSARPEKKGKWRRAQISIPEAVLKTIELQCDRKDLEVQFDNALNIKKEEKNGHLFIKGFIADGKTVGVKWKPEVEQLKGKLVLSADATTAVTASVGALSLNTLYRYRISQGSLKQLSFDVPEGISIVRVTGESIRDWTIEKKEAKRTLIVSLSTPVKESYSLQVGSEMILGDFPADFTVPCITPLGVIRNSGFLVLGSDSAVKMTVRSVKGLSQINREAMPGTKRKGKSMLRMPSNVSFVYQYASAPYNIRLKADDIFPVYSATDTISLFIRDDGLVVRAMIELDVKEAPLRRASVHISRKCIVSRVDGKGISDFDVVNESTGGQEIKLSFGDGVRGKNLIQIELESDYDLASGKITVPSIRVAGAQSERGFIVAAAERGIEIRQTQSKNLRQVHTLSLPVRVPGAQNAFRFKESAWKLNISLTILKSSINSECFHLISLGDGIMYGSTTVNCHIAGAPTDTLSFRIPRANKGVEFIGPDIRRWTKNNDIWSVKLQKKIIGLYTLTLLYNQTFSDETRNRIRSIGGVTPLNIDNESGYIVVTGLPSQRVKAENLSRSLVATAPEDLPQGYKIVLNAPVIQAFRYISGPHQADIRISEFGRAEPLDVAVDMTEYETTLNTDGEAVTRAVYMVKNATAQFISIRLPNGAQAWSVTVDSERVTASTSGTNVLIPIKRHRNPNQPTRVELTYAESRSELGFMKTFDLQTPDVSAQTTFTRWTIRLPRNWQFGNISGQLSLEQSSSSPVRPADVFQSILSALRRMHDVNAACLGAALIAAIMLIAMARVRARRRTVLTGLIQGLILGIFGMFFIAGIGMLDICYLAWPAQEASAVLATSLNMSGDPLGVAFQVQPDWFFLCGGRYMPLVLLAVGIALAATSVLQKKKWLGAVALLLLVYSAGSTHAGRLLLLTGLLWIVPPFILFLICRSFKRSDDPLPQTQPAPTAAVKSLLIIGCLFGFSASAQAGKKPETPALLSVDYEFLAHKKHLTGSLCLKLKMHKHDEVAALPPGFIYTGSRLPDGLEIHLSDGVRKVLSKKNGTFTAIIEFLCPYHPAQTKSKNIEPDSNKFLVFDISPALKNSVSLTVPNPDMEITSVTAVHFTEKRKEKTSRALARFLPGDTAILRWRPRTRQTRLEKTVFFCEENSLLFCRPGVLECANSFVCRIAQGEIRQFRVQIPHGMNVTLVEGDKLGTWRFDPESRLLEAVLYEPVTGRYELRVVTQLAVDGLPYKKKVSLPVMLDCDRLRGAVAVSADDSVSIQASADKEFIPMNSGDFPVRVLGMLNRPKKSEQSLLRRAFRYIQADGMISLKAIRVLPEIRTAENSAFSVSDERLEMSTTLALDILKAGIFDVRLRVPEGYDISSLSGNGVSHWDEIQNRKRDVIVYFNRKTMGRVLLNIALSRTPEGRLTAVTVPGVRVPDSAKHTGTLSISSQKGIRLSVEKMDSVLELDPRKIGLKGKDILAFKMLRPDWKVDLKAEEASARLVVDSLAAAEFSEGMMTVRNHFHYTITHAGVKIFHVRLPDGATGIEIFGAGISKTQPESPDGLSWKVELGKKVFDKYNLTVVYKRGFKREDPVVALEPVSAVSAALQRWHIVVKSNPGIEIVPETKKGEFTEAEARYIPSFFRAGDLSGAILCYKTPAENFLIHLNVKRHSSARMLPASVNRVLIETVVAHTGQSITRVEMEMQVGGKRFLQMKLPPGSSLWSTLVNNGAVVPSKVKDAFLVPLNQFTSSKADTRLEITYTSKKSSTWQPRNQHFIGPSFDLPLKNIVWRLYVPEGLYYYGYDGTMEFSRAITERGRKQVFDISSYNVISRELTNAESEQSMELLTTAQKQAESGLQQEARDTMQKAYNYSISRSDLNEDARVQLRNLQRRQAVVGLLNRRGMLKPSFTGKTDANEDLDHFTEEYARRLESALSREENVKINKLAERMIAQQFEAQPRAWPLKLNLSRQGTQLVFERSLQIKPDMPMEIAFKVMEKKRVDTATEAAGLLGILLLFAGAVALRKKAKEGR